MRQRRGEVFKILLVYKKILHLHATVNPYPQGRGESDAGILYRG